jgi:hypothetical protein
MKAKISFDIESAMKEKITEYAKQQNMTLTGVLNFIVNCHFDRIDQSADTLKRLEDKIDTLLLQDNSQTKSNNKDNYQKIVKCIKDNAQNIGVVALIELIDIIPELKSIMDKDEN